MDQPEVMQKAAALFAEWREGDEFEYKIYDNSDKYATIQLDRVLDHLGVGHIVRLKPKPVRTVRKMSEILADAETKGSIIFPLIGKEAHAAIRCDSNQCNWILIDRLAFWIGKGEEQMRDSFEVTIPDWFFTTETPTPPVDRIAEAIDAAYKKYLKEDPNDGEGATQQLMRLIREECSKRNIT